MPTPTKPESRNPEPGFIAAAYATQPPKIDGLLDDPVWSIAPKYALTYDQPRLEKGLKVAEGGYAQFAWDDTALYAATAFVDSDVYTRVTADQQKTWDLGDVSEWFLGAVDGSYYLEMHVCPLGFRTGFLLTAPRQGKPLEPLTYTAAARTGSVPLSLPGWSAEFRMSWDALRQVSPKFGPDTPWRCLIGRYNYNRSTPKPELTMYPSQPRLDYHAIDHHAPLRLLPAAQ